MNLRVYGFLALLFITCLLLAAGCTTTAPAKTSEPAKSPATAQQAPRSPTDAELKSIIGNFDAYAEHARQEWGLPGMAISIVKDGKIIFVKGYGTKIVGGTDPVTPDTLFEIGSTSKAFTTALVAMEVDKGTIGWNDRVIDHLPEFRMSDPWVTKEFTITDTMAQRSGLGDHWGSDLSVLGYNRTEMIRAQQYAQPVSSFRSQYMYQNVMFLVPAAIVEKKTGRAWEDDVKLRIFTPLGMAHSTTTLAGFRSANDVITLHTVGKHDDGTVGAVALPSDWPIADFGEKIGPAGGIGSTAHDMARWAIFQLGNGTADSTQLISPASMNFMHSPKTPMGQNMDIKQYYAQGWIYQEMPGGAIVWHNGETLGSHAMVLLVPRENLGIVVLGNMAGGMDLPDQLATQFYLDYFGYTGIDLCNDTLPAYRGKLAQGLIEKAPPASPVPALPLSQYTGTYRSDVYGPAVVSEQNGTLRVAMGKRPVNLVLAHWDNNTFRWTAPEIGKFASGFATFDVDASGTPVRLTSDLFIESSYGTKATFARGG